MKKIGLIALIVVLALGIIGVGYAAWTQSLQVNGTVNPGTFNVKIVGSAATTPATYSTVTYGSTAGVNDGNNAPLSVTIDYAVPGTYLIPLKITNNSTIPVAIAYAGISNTLPAGSAVTGGPIATTLAAGANDSGTTLTVTLPDTMVKTGGTYTFTVPISVTQGN